MKRLIIPSTNIMFIEQDNDLAVLTIKKSSTVTEEITININDIVSAKCIRHGEPACVHTYTSSRKTQRDKCFDIFEDLYNCMFNNKGFNKGTYTVIIDYKN